MGDIPRIHVLIGPTASGKSAVALHLADALGAQIICADSMKVYRGMDIGTAKPTPAERTRYGYYGVDVRRIGQAYDARQFVADCEAAIARIRAAGDAVLIEGGTPLYLKCLSEGLFDGPAADLDLRARLRATAQRHGPAVLHRRLARCDPVSAARLHPHDLKRVVRALEVFELSGTPISRQQQQFGRPRSDLNFVWAGLRWNDEVLKARIAARYGKMLEAGWPDEVRRIRQQHGALGRTSRQAIGYHELGLLLDGAIDADEARTRVVRATWQLARRQRSWFGRFADVCWVDATEPFDPAAAARTILASWHTTPRV
jgi:tRNA dimethylallyltransferase